HSTLPIGNEGNIAFFGSDNPGIPSVEAAKIWRKKQNLPNFDFFNFAGINRPVRIYSTPASYIRDITLVPSIEGDTGVLNYEILTDGIDSDAPVTLKIIDAESNCKAALDIFFTSHDHEAKLLIELGSSGHNYSPPAHSSSKLSDFFSYKPVGDWSMILMSLYLVFFNIADILSV
ncbi:Beta-galactosidase/beta-glucuronidase, partial [human gut metagenome]